MIVARLLYLGIDSTYAGTEDYLKAESCSNLEIFDSRTKRMLEYEKGFLDDVSQTRAAGPVNVIGGEITTGVAVQNSGAIIEGGNSLAPAGYGEPIPVVAGAAARPTTPSPNIELGNRIADRQNAVEMRREVETVKISTSEPEPEPDPTPPPKEDPTPPPDPGARDRGR
jgi:hypothetical protein